MSSAKNILSDPFGYMENAGVLPTPEQRGKIEQLVEITKPLLIRQKELDGQKKQYSREIGEKKRLGEDVASLLEKMKTVSLELKNCLQQLQVQKEYLLELVKVHQPSPVKAPRQDMSQTPICYPNSEEPEADSIGILSEQNLEWDQYIGNHPSASVYHLLKWKQVIEESFGHQTFYLYATRQGKIKGVLPLVRLKSRLFGDFMLSLPFFNYGGVLADSEPVARQLLEYAQNIAENSYGCDHIEYRDIHEKTKWPVRTDKVVMLLDLPNSSDTLWEKLGTKLRAQIKRPIKEGMTARIGGESLLDDFYGVFCRNMRDLGTPVYARSFFQRIIKSHDAASIVIVYHNNMAVAAGFLIGFKEKLEIPWASTLRSANKYSANMLLYWQCLKYAIDQGYQVFDFGRSTVDSNTFRFKKQWGAKPQQLYWHYWLASGDSPPQINPGNPKYQLAIRCWQKLPVALTRVIGPLVAKNLP